MFLNILTREQKEYFLELAYNGMMADGAIQAREQGIFDGFRAETGLLQYELKGTTTIELLELLAGATKPVKKTIIIELLGVLYDDDDENADAFHPESNGLLRDEQEFIRSVAAEWNIRDRDLKKMIRWVQDFDEILEKGYDLIIH